MTTTAIEGLADRHTEPKKWGWEEWIVNNDLYCGKRLHFTVLRGSTSLHFHVKKHETMYVESGNFNISVIDKHGQLTTHYLAAGDSLVIPQYMPHRITAMSVPAVLIEFSTHHENSDSYRISNSWFVDESEPE